MNKFKILRILSLTTVCLLINSAYVFAAKNETEKKNIEEFPESEENVKYFGQKVSEIKGKEMPIENIGGFNFKQVAKNNQDGILFFEDDKKFNFAVKLNEKKSNRSFKDNFDLKILFIIPIKNAKGMPHAVEHIITNYLRDISGMENDVWFSAYTGMTLPIFKGVTGKYIKSDLKNCCVELIFKDEFFKDEKRWEALGKALLGDLLKDKNKIKEYYSGEVYSKYKDKETSRMFVEIEGRENTKDPMDKMDNDINERYLLNGMFKYWGDLNELKNITVEDLEKCYKKYFVDAKPLIILNCKTKEEAERKISLLNKYYLKNKEKSEVAEDGQLEFEPENYIERKATDLELSEFSYVIQENKRKNKEIDNIGRIKFVGKNELNEMDDAVLSCLKEDYVKNMVDYKDLGVEDFFITTSGGGLHIEIKGNKNKKFSFSKEELLKVAEEVKQKLLEKIKKDGIKKEDLDRHMLAAFARGCEDRNIGYEDIIKKMDYSSRRYKTPFSEKYFIVDKNNNLIKGVQKIMPLVEDYFIKNFKRILEEILKNEPKIENIVKPKGRSNEDNLKEADAYEPEQTKLPFKYKLNSKENELKNNVCVKLTEESIYEKVLHPLVKKGLLYKYPEGRNAIEKYPEMAALSETEKRNLELYFKEDFKKDLKNLEKDFDNDKYLKKLKEKYIKIIEKQKQKIADEKKVQEKGLKNLEKIKSELNEKLKNTTDICSVMDEIEKNSVKGNVIDTLLENIRKMVFLAKKENENYEKMFEENIKKNKFKIKNCYAGPKNNDIKKIRNNIEKLIELEITSLKNFMHFEEIVLGKIGNYQKESKNIRNDDILKILKEIVVDDYYKVNSEKEKNKDKKKFKID